METDDPGTKKGVPQMNKEQEAILKSVRAKLGTDDLEDTPNPQEAETETEDRSLYQDIIGGAGKIAQGATFGYADEIRARVRTEVDNALTAMGLPAIYGNKTYEENVAEARGLLHDFAEANPYTAFGLELGGGAATGGVGAAKVLGVKAIQNAPKLGKYLAAGGVGAGQGAVAGSGYATEGNRLKGAGMGAAIGGPLGVAAPAAVSGVRRLLSPKSNVGGAANKLVQEGISLTPGQRLGGVVQTAEDAATSIPILGGAIRGAQTRGIEDFNRVAINKALAPIGQKLSEKTPVGREAVGEMLEKASKAYSGLLPKVRFNMDVQFRSQLNELIDNAQFLSEGTFKKFQSIVEKNLASKLDAKMGMSGEALKTAESNLGKLATTLSRATDQEAVQLSGAVKQLQALMRESLERSNPAQAAQLRNANSTYRMASIVEDASVKAAGKNNGVFNPSQLDRAVKSAQTMGKPKRQYAKGQATMQDLSDPAVKVLSPTIPESGTAPRLMTAAMLSGGGAAIDPITGIATGIAAGTYTRPGQQFLNMMMNRPMGAPKLADRAKGITAPTIGAGSIYAGR